ncbi:hypothetical protein B9G55_19335 [Saccharibacillus sp. O16]|nr:hypothetical protein B9G55_19335 [Saccharibacillus sp. O16]
MRIQERVNEDDITFSSFTFTYNDVLYYGVISARQQEKEWFKLSMNMNKRFEKEPASIVTFSGEALLPNQNKKKQSYQMIYGYVNDANIAKVIVRYKGGKISVIQLGESQKLYMEYNLIPQEIMDIQLQDKEGKVILKKDYNS